TETYVYDTPLDQNFQGYYVNGRLSYVQYRGGGTGFWSDLNANAPCATQFTEIYAYEQQGAVVKKRLRTTRYKSSGTLPYYTAMTADLDSSYTVGQWGKPTETVYPPTGASSAGGSFAAGPDLTFTYDAMQRPLTSSGGVTGATYNVAGELTSI